MHACISRVVSMILRILAVISRTLWDSYSDGTVTQLTYFKHQCQHLLLSDLPDNALYVQFPSACTNTPWCLSPQTTTVRTAVVYCTERRIHRLIMYQLHHLLSQSKTSKQTLSQHKTHAKISKPCPNGRQVSLVPTQPMQEISGIPTGIT